MGARRRFSREFKVEAVTWVLERRVAMAQAARDLGVHVNVLRSWVRAHRADPGHAFPGEGQQKPEAAELTRLRREVTRRTTATSSTVRLLRRAPIFCATVRRSPQSRDLRCCWATPTDTSTESIRSLRQSDSYDTNSNGTRQLFPPLAGGSTGWFR